MRKTELKEFEEKVRAVYSELYLFLYKYFNEESLTKDAIQNTFMKGYENYKSLKDRDKFKSWIFTIGRREALNILEKRGKEINFNVDYIENVIVQKETFDLPEERVLNKELKDVIIQAINGLNEDLKQIVIQKYYMGMTFEEISKIYNTNSNTIRSRHLRAKKYIHKYILENYYKD